MGMQPELNLIYLINNKHLIFNLTPIIIISYESNLISNRKWMKGMANNLRIYLICWNQIPKLKLIHFLVFYSIIIRNCWSQMTDVPIIEPKPIQRVKNEIVTDKSASSIFSEYCFRFRRVNVQLCHWFAVIKSAILSLAIIYLCICF